jgi:aminopeptidase-like protein
MALFDLAAALYPLCRSITGDGVRRSLALIGRITPPMTLHEVPTGTPVLDVSSIFNGTACMCSTTARRCIV